MADFEQIQSIQTVANENDLKGLLKLKIAGATEPLTISCPSLSAAEDMAGLIDGYCKLVNSGKESCWNRKGNCQIMMLCTAVCGLVMSRLSNFDSRQSDTISRLIVD